MDKEPIEDESRSLYELVKKSIIWIIAIFIALMMIAAVLFQPSFFTFLN